MRRLIAAALSMVFYTGLLPAQEQQSRSPLFDEITEILAQLSELTGWKAPKKVESDTITKEGLKGFLESRMQEMK